MAMENTEISLPFATGSIESYVQYANSLPLLTREEEYDLANAWQDKQDLPSAQRLVLSHLRYVVRVAKSYMGYGLNLADLIQEGTIGLMKAVKKFKPEREVRLVTFAMHWIKAEIHEFIIRNWRIVKIATTKSQRKLFFKLRSKKKGTSWLSNQEISEIAKDLGVKEKEVVQMEARLAFGDTSFDLPNDDDDGAGKLSYAPVEYLEDKSANPAESLENNTWNNLIHDGLHTAIKKLDDRSQQILQRRWLNDEKATLEELAQQYNVSKERIRQIEVKALTQIKDALAEEL